MQAGARLVFLTIFFPVLVPHLVLYGIFLNPGGLSNSSWTPHGVPTMILEGAELVG
jgi:hypothetical protein